MENKQTSVEWLIEKVNSPEWQDCFIWHKEEIFQQALAMEKDQIEESFKNGRLPLLFGSFKAEDYYNETYGK